MERLRYTNNNAVWPGRAAGQQNGRRKYIDVAVDVMPQAASEPRYVVEQPNLTSRGRERERMARDGRVLEEDSVQSAFLQAQPCGVLARE